VYSFKGWGSAVTCIVQAPAVDTVGIGLEDGRTVCHWPSPIRVLAGCR
jgi:hypothetical protein